MWTSNRVIYISRSKCGRALIGALFATSTACAQCDPGVVVQVLGPQTNPFTDPQESAGAVLALAPDEAPSFVVEVRDCAGRDGDASLLRPPSSVRVFLLPEEAPIRLDALQHLQHDDRVALVLASALVELVRDAAVSSAGVKYSVPENFVTRPGRYRAIALLDPKSMPEGALTAVGTRGGVAGMSLTAWILDSTVPSQARAVLYRNCVRSYDKGNGEQVLACLSQLRELCPGSAQALATSAWFMERLNMTDAARANYRLALDVIDSGSSACDRWLSGETRDDARRAWALGAGLASAPTQQQ